TFRQVFSRDFRLPAPERHIHKSRLFPLLVRLLVEPLTANRHSDFSHGGSTGGVSHLRIAGQISNKDDFVKTRHRSSPAFRNRLLRRREIEAIAMPHQNSSDRPLLRERGLRDGPRPGTIPSVPGCESSRRATSKRLPWRRRQLWDAG